SFIPAELNHFLALVGAIGCAGSLNRDRAADRWLAASLALALASAGGGVAVAAACVAHNLCTRASARRWLSVLGPAALWGSWWLIVGRGYGAGASLTPQQAISFTTNLIEAAFSSLGLHASVLGRLLTIAYLAVGCSVLRGGARGAANWLAWTAGLGVWSIGLAYSRGFLTDLQAFRYQFVAVGFILLAVVPRQPIQTPSWLLRRANRSRAAGLVVVVILSGAVRFNAMAVELREPSQFVSQVSRESEGRLVVLGLTPEVVPEDRVLPIAMGGLRAADIRSLLDRYEHSAPASVDRFLVTSEVTRSFGRPAPLDQACQRVTAPFSHTETASGRPLSLWSVDVDVDVDVRRFGSEWIRLGTAHAGRGLRIVLPGLDSGVPWQVRAVGACRAPVSRQLAAAPQEPSEPYRS
ncbi:MAG: hypothetical protein ABIP36_00845, partial [Acidimicrobiales bacterium]